VASASLFGGGVVTWLTGLNAMVVAFLESSLPYNSSLAVSIPSLAVVSNGSALCLTNNRYQWPWPSRQASAETTKRTQQSVGKNYRWLNATTIFDSTTSKLSPFLEQLSREQVRQLPGWDKEACQQIPGQSLTGTGEREAEVAAMGALLESRESMRQLVTGMQWNIERIMAVDGLVQSNSSSAALFPTARQLQLEMLQNVCQQNKDIGNHVIGTLMEAENGLLIKFGEAYLSMAATLSYLRTQNAELQSVMISSSGKYVSCKSSSNFTSEREALRNATRSAQYRVGNATERVVTVLTTARVDTQGEGLELQALLHVYQARVALESAHIQQQWVHFFRVYMDYVYQHECKRNASSWKGCTEASEDELSQWESFVTSIYYDQVHLDLLSVSQQLELLQSSPHTSRALHCWQTMTNRTSDQITNFTNFTLYSGGDFTFCGHILELDSRLVVDASFDNSTLRSTATGGSLVQFQFERGTLCNMTCIESKVATLKELRVSAESLAALQLTGDSAQVLSRRRLHSARWTEGETHLQESIPDRGVKPMFGCDELANCVNGGWHCTAGAFGLECTACAVGEYCLANTIPRTYSCSNKPGDNSNSVYTTDTWGTAECPYVCVPVDYYKTSTANDYGSATSTCTSVGVGHYSPASDNTRTSCTNGVLSAFEAYVSSGGGTNNCDIGMAKQCQLASGGSLGEDYTVEGWLNISSLTSAFSSGSVSIWDIEKGNKWSLTLQLYGTHVQLCVNATVCANVSETFQFTLEHYSSKYALSIDGSLSDVWTASLEAKTLDINNATLGGSLNVPATGFLSGLVNELRFYNQSSEWVIPSGYFTSNERIKKACPSFSHVIREGTCLPRCGNFGERKIQSSAECHCDAGYESCGGDCVPKCPSGMQRGVACGCACAVSEVMVWKSRYVSLRTPNLTSDSQQYQDAGNGYMALSEIMFFLSNGTLIVPKNCTASSSALLSGCEKLYDGKRDAAPSSQWISATPEGYVDIVFDLGSVALIDEIAVYNYVGLKSYGVLKLKAVSCSNMQCSQSFLLSQPKQLLIANSTANVLYDNATSFHTRDGSTDVQIVTCVACSADALERATMLSNGTRSSKRHCMCAQDHNHLRQNCIPKQSFLPSILEQSGVYLYGRGIHVTTLSDGLYLLPEESVHYVCVTTDGTIPVSCHFDAANRIHDGLLYLNDSVGVQQINFRNFQVQRDGSAVVTRIFTVLGTLNTTIVTPSNIVYNASVAVSLQCFGIPSNATASIYYTLDGSSPVANPQRLLYSSSTPIVLTAKATREIVQVCAICEDSYYLNSTVAVANFTIQPVLPAPVISPLNFTLMDGENVYHFDDAATINISSTISETVIMYRLQDHHYVPFQSLAPGLSNGNVNVTLTCLYNFLYCNYTMSALTTKQFWKSSPIESVKVSIAATAKPLVFKVNPLIGKFNLATNVSMSCYSPRYMARIVYKLCKLDAPCINPWIELNTTDLSLAALGDYRIQSRCQSDLDPSIQTTETVSYINVTRIADPVTVQVVPTAVPVGYLFYLNETAGSKLYYNTSTLGTFSLYQSAGIAAACPSAGSDCIFSFCAFNSPFNFFEGPTLCFQSHAYPGLEKPTFTDSSGTLFVECPTPISQSLLLVASRNGAVFMSVIATNNFTLQLNETMNVTATCTAMNWWNSSAEWSHIIPLGLLSPVIEPPSGTIIGPLTMSASCPGTGKLYLAFGQSVQVSNESRYIAPLVIKREGSYNFAVLCNDGVNSSNITTSSYNVSEIPGTLSCDITSGGTVPSGTSIKLLGRSNSTQLFCSLSGSVAISDWTELLSSQSQNLTCSSSACLGTLTCFQNRTYNGVMSNITICNYTVLQVLRDPVLTPSSAQIYYHNFTAAASCPDAVANLNITDASLNVSVLNVKTWSQNFNQSVNITAACFAMDYWPSTLTGHYVVESARIPNPPKCLASGTYRDSIHLNFSCSNPDCYIIYTLDGSKPSKSNGKLLTADKIATGSEQDISSGETYYLKAIAVVDGLDYDEASAILTRIYSIETSLGLMLTIPANTTTFATSPTQVNITCREQSATCLYQLENGDKKECIGSSALVALSGTTRVNLWCEKRNHYYDHEKLHIFYYEPPAIISTSSESEKEPQTHADSSNGMDTMDALQDVLSDPEAVVVGVLISVVAILLFCICIPMTMLLCIGIIAFSFTILSKQAISQVAKRQHYKLLSDCEMSAIALGYDLTEQEES
jgi:hypothetical protein